jgi:hypothetical protein
LRAKSGVRHGGAVAAGILSPFGNHPADRPLLGVLRSEDAASVHQLQSGDHAIEGWSIAAGTATLATTRGGFQVRGTTVAAEFGRSEYESELEHQIDATLVSTRYPQFSTSLVLNEDVGFGLSYREEPSSTRS